MKTVSGNSRFRRFILVLVWI